MIYKIAGHDVEFPHQAYGVQLSFMDKVLRTLENEGNALLEAPTGSGKTLSLLCSALAWQRRRLYSQLDLQQVKGEEILDEKQPPLKSPSGLEKFRLELNLYCKLSNKLMLLHRKHTLYS